MSCVVGEDRREDESDYHIDDRDKTAGRSHDRAISGSRSNTWTWRTYHSYRAMYRLRKKEGDALLHATVSRVLSDALARRTGRIKTQELRHAYQHLTPLVGSA